MPSTSGESITWGCATTGLTYTGSVGTLNITSEDLSKEATEYITKDRQGQSQTAYYYDGKSVLSLQVFPSGANHDITATPSVGETVTVVASSDSDLAGTWICQSVSRTRSNEGHAEFSLTLVKFDGWTPS